MLHCTTDFASRFAETAQRILNTSCSTPFRQEVDDDATYFADGLHVDPGVDQCGEWFLLKSVGGGLETW